METISIHEILKTVKLELLLEHREGLGEYSLCGLGCDLNPDEDSAYGAYLYDNLLCNPPARLDGLGQKAAIGDKFFWCWHPNDYESRLAWLNKHIEITNPNYVDPAQMSIYDIPGVEI